MTPKPRGASGGAPKRRGPNRGGLLSPAEAGEFCRREEERMRREESELERVDPFYESQVRQVVKMIGIEKTRRLLDRVAAEESWVLVNERLPEEGAIVEFVDTRFRTELLVGFYDGNLFRDHRYHAPKHILCWRPARPIGELPGEKQDLKIDTDSG